MYTVIQPPAKQRSTVLGQTGAPIINVNNNCSTGSTALWLARQAVASAELSDCVLALGFEQMVRGALAAVYTDRPAADAALRRSRAQIQGIDESAPMAAQFFGGAGQAYVDEFGIDPAVFAEISVKARKHAANNPYAVFRDPITVEEVLASPHDLRPAHPAAVLPADVRRRGGGRLLARVRRRGATCDRMS